MRRLPYRIIKPPRAVRKTRLDNLALVPASLLPFKDAWQQIANDLPRGSVLICASPSTMRIKAILGKVAQLLRDKGHHVLTLPVTYLSASTSR